MRPRLLTPSFVIAWAVSLVSGLAYFLFIHFPGHLRDLGADEAQIGLVIATTALAAISIRPWIGRSLDRRGRRPVILLGAVIHVAAVLLYLTVDGITLWLYVVRVIHGIGMALSFAAVFTYAADIIPDGRRTEGLALFGVSGLLPIAIGGVLGDLILAHADYTAMYLASAGLAAVALVLVLPLRESANPAPDGTRISFTRPLLQRDLLPMWWVTLVFSFALTAYFAFMRTFVDETGVGSVGAFFGAYATTAILLRVFAGWVPDRFGLKRTLYPAMVVFATGFVLLASAGSTMAIVVAGIFCGAGHGYGFPILFAIAFGRAGRVDRGSASAIFTGLFDLGSLTGAPILGAMVTWFGYPTMFRIAAVWVMVGLIAFAAWEHDLPGGRRRHAIAHL